MMVTMTGTGVDPFSMLYGLSRMTVKTVLDSLHRGPDALRQAPDQLKA